MPIATTSLAPKIIANFWEQMPAGLQITETPGQNPVPFHAGNLPPGATYKLIEAPEPELSGEEFEIEQMQFSQPAEIHAEGISYRAAALWNKMARVTDPVEMKTGDSLIRMTGIMWQGRISEDVILDSKGRPNYGSLAEEGVLSLMGQQTPIHAGAQIGVNHELGQVTLVCDSSQGFNFWINGVRCLLNKWVKSEGREPWVEFSNAAQSLLIPYSEGSVALKRNSSAEIREDGTIRHAELDGKVTETNTQLVQRLRVKDKAYAFVPGTCIEFDALGRIVSGCVIDQAINDLPEIFLRGQRPVSRIQVVYDNENHATVTFVPDIVFYLLDLPKGARGIRTEQIP